jgi:hypothetical protein
MSENQPSRSKTSQAMPDLGDANPLRLANPRFFPFQSTTNESPSAVHRLHRNIGPPFGHHPTSLSNIAACPRSTSMAQRILLAGPDSRKLSPFPMALASRGHEVRIETTGLGCLEAIRNWRPNLLVMNPDLTWGSGFGVLGVIFEDLSIPIIPVVLVTDDAVRVRSELKLLAEALRLKTDRRGWTCHLHREPFGPSDLLKVADELFLQSQHVHSLATTESG